MIKFANDLTAAARNELVAFCAKNLRPGLDPVRYADGLIEEADLTSSAHFEIRGFDTNSGNAVTINFSDAELVWEEMEE